MLNFVRMVQTAVVHAVPDVSLHAGDSAHEISNRAVSRGAVRRHVVLHPVRTASFVVV